MVLTFANNHRCCEKSHSDIHNTYTHTKLAYEADHLHMNLYLNVLHRNVMFTLYGMHSDDVSK